MPYTLTMGLLWFALALLLGLVIGWLLRSIRATRQIRAARATHHDAAELERLRARVANLEPAVSENDRLKAALAASPVAAVAPEPSPGAEPVAEPAPEAVAVADASAGETPYAVDDLTVIEGIGPTIADLVHGIGVHTWADLAQTEVSLLRTMLADAGPEFAMHQPDTWPEQAGLLAAGRHVQDVSDTS